MIGLAIGDFLGSSYEFKLFEGKFRFKEFPTFNSLDDVPKDCRYTDDTILSFALVEALLTGEPYHLCLKKWAIHYPNGGYGHFFFKWIQSTKTSYRSYGNGAAVRATVLGHVYKDDPKKLVEEVTKFTNYTHGHPEALKGAIMAAKMAAVYHNEYRSDFTHEEKIAFSNKLLAMMHQEFPHVVREGKKGEYDYTFTDFDELSRDGMPSAKSDPTVPHGLLVACFPDTGTNMLARAMYLNEDPDTQGALVGGIIDNSIFDYSPITKEFAIEKFDKRMLYWYEKFTKTYDLE